MNVIIQTLDKALSWRFLTGFAVATMVALAYAENLPATLLAGVVAGLCNEFRKGSK